MRGQNTHYQEPKCTRLLLIVEYCGVVIYYNYQASANDGNGNGNWEWNWKMEIVVNTEMMILCQLFAYWSALCQYWM